MKFESLFLGADKRKSSYDVTFSGIRENNELVIFCHGYKGFKDWGHWNLVAERFAEEGYDFLKFNFSHNGGTVKQPIDFPDELAFANNTYSKELEDIGHILQLVDDGIMKDQTPQHYSRIHLIGHSRGGGMAVLAAAHYQKFQSLTTWAAVADFGERFSFDLNNWKQNGVAHVKNSRTGQRLPHNFSFYQDYITHRDKLDILAAADRIKIPWLIAHGENDEAVEFENARRLYERSPNSRLTKLERTGHTFGGHHPWETSQLPNPMSDLCDQTINFIKS